MNVVLYASGKDEAVSQRLQKVTESKVSLKHLETIQTIEDLSKRVRRLPREIDIAVLLAQSNDQLSELFPLKEFLEDVRIILILPDWERETITKGHLLRPRYIDDVNGDFSNVGAVLEKMSDSMKDNQNLQEGGESKSDKKIC